MTYPNDPGFTDHETSFDAATAMAPTAPVLRQLAFAEINKTKANTPPGLTADQIASRLNLSVLAIRPRVSELYKSGAVFKTGERRPNHSGLNAHVWSAP